MAADGKGRREPVSTVQGRGGNWDPTSFQMPGELRAEALGLDFVGGVG